MLRNLTFIIFIIQTLKQNCNIVTYFCKFVTKQAATCNTKHYEYSEYFAPRESNLATCEEETSNDQKGKTTSVNEAVKGVQVIVFIFVV